MRQLHVQVPDSSGERVLELGEECGAFSPLSTPMERGGGETWRMIFLNLPNDRVGSFIGRVAGEVENAEFVLFPYGTLPVRLPLSDVRKKLREVSPRSPLELVLAALQSIGSWKGLVLYALFSGVVAAYGLLVNAGYMLVAAMLIAPVGAPVMVSVVGASIGDRWMIGRGALRFVAAILVLIAAATAVGFGYGLSVSSILMEQVTSLSTWGFVVALVAGAAGAQSLIESDRSSLVTATATGFLIAAALSPTSAVLGLAIPLGRWDYVAMMAFQLLLQYVALVLGGMLALLGYGIRPDDQTLERGSKRWRTGYMGALLLALPLLVLLQVARSPGFVKADLSREAVRISRQALETEPIADLVAAEAAFTRTDLERYPGETMLLTLVVESSAPDSIVGSRLRAALAARLAREMPEVVPLISIQVIPGPEAR